MPEDQGRVFEVTAQAGERRIRMVTADMDYVQRQVARFMPPRDHEVPAKWYARLYSYLDEAFRRGQVEFNRFGRQPWVITVRRVNTTNNSDGGNGGMSR